jgi:hypothetical protein
MKKFPGSGAVDLASDIETIVANLSFDELANMRAQSTSGGALGGIAVKELDLLGSTVASLRQEQSPPQLRENMQKIRYHYDRWLLAVEGKDPDKVGTGPRETGGPSNRGKSGGQRDLSEGTVIRNAEGKELVLRNGQWVPR